MLTGPAVFDKKINDVSFVAFDIRSCRQVYRISGIWNGIRTSTIFKWFSIVIRILNIALHVLQVNFRKFIYSSR